MKPNQKWRICHTPISHWLRFLGYVGFEFTLSLVLKLSKYCVYRVRLNTGFWLFSDVAWKPHRESWKMIALTSLKTCVNFYVSLTHTRHTKKNSIMPRLPRQNRPKKSCHKNPGSLPPKVAILVRGDLQWQQNCRGGAGYAEACAGLELLMFGLCRKLLVIRGIIPTAEWRALNAHALNPEYPVVIPGTKLWASAKNSSMLIVW